MKHAITELMKDRKVLEREATRLKTEREEKVARIEVIDRHIPDLEDKISQIDSALSLISKEIGIDEQGVIA